jgi:hypothetical protein
MGPPHFRVIYLLVWLASLFRNGSDFQKIPPDKDLPPIHTVRGQRVMLDGALARLYGVTTKVFNQTIRRNVDRFPADFAFQLTREDLAILRSQIVTSSFEGPRSPRS